MYIQVKLDVVYSTREKRIIGTSVRIYWMWRLPALQPGPKDDPVNRKCVRNISTSWRVSAQISHLDAAKLAGAFPVKLNWFASSV